MKKKLLFQLFAKKHCMTDMDIFYVFKLKSTFANTAIY